MDKVADKVVVAEAEDHMSVADGFAFGLGLAFAFGMLALVAGLLGALFQYLEKLDGK